MSLASLTVGRVRGRPMRRLTRLLTFAIVALFALPSEARSAPEAGPIRQLAENPRYLSYRGEPIVLVTAGEHYGAVLNADFDFEAYLTALAADGMNLTRVFAGTYVEPPGAFGITRNTLAPARGRYLSALARSEIEGYAGGGNRFDLSRSSQPFVDRLHRFLDAAERAGVIVELTFFSSIYSEKQWALHPWNPSNNVQATPLTDFRTLHTNDAPETLIRSQIRLVRHLVGELNRHDNLIYEIQNEPWADNHTLGARRLDEWVDRDRFPNRIEVTTPRSIAWQRRVGAAIADRERSLPKRHLIAQNVANFALPVREDDLVPEVALLNFHYAEPAAVRLNRGKGRVIGFDESGFAGTEAETYLRQAWRFLMAGGGTFNHLDYSFSVGHESGDDRDNEAHGSSDPRLRKHLAVLSRFLNRLDLRNTEPQPQLVQRADGVAASVLGNGSDELAVYAEGRFPASVTLALPTAQWTIEHWDVTAGLVRRERLSADNAPVTIDLKSDRDMAAIRLTRVGSQSD